MSAGRNNIYRRRPDPVRLGNFLKELRDVVDGKGSPGSTVPSPQSEDGGQKPHAPTAEVEEARLPYADE